MELFRKDVVTVAEMKELERLGDAAGLPYYDMMENAGTCAAEYIMACQQREIEDLDFDFEPDVIVFCGKGNNGGDGFVVARKLAQEGWDVQAVLVEGEPKTKDAMTNFKLLPESVKVCDIRDFEIHDDETPLYVVDAVYGTGYKGELREDGKLAVSIINALAEAGSGVFALDIPSGLPGDLSAEDVEKIKDCVAADCTISFHAMKPVHTVKEIDAVLGDVITVDIGLTDVLGK